MAMKPSNLKKKTFVFYSYWAEIVGALALHWNMQDRLSDMSITAMYKAGHDSLGEEMFPSYSTLKHSENSDGNLMRQNQSIISIL